MGKHRTRAESLLVLVTLVWGGTFAVIQWGLEDVSPMLMVAIRFLLAALMAWPILVRTPKNSSETVSEQPLPPSPFLAKTWIWGAVIGLGMLAGYAGQTIGLQYTTAARSGFITFTFALYIPFLQFFILGKKPGLGNLIGLFAVMYGLSFITDPASTRLSFQEFSPLRILRVGRELLTGGMNTGDLFTLAGAVGYAFYVVLLDKATRVCHPGAVTVVQMLSCGVFALCLAFVVEEPYLHLSPRFFLSMAYLVVLGSVLALALMNWFQRELSPLRAVLIYALEPVFAALIGWLAFREGMNVREITGALCILSGILLSDLWEMMKQRFFPKKDA